MKVITKTSVTSNISRVGDIWKGEIPTTISITADSYSEKLEFPITGLLPISVLADKALGVDVEFEIWSEAGVKLGSTTIYSFSWNPVGPNTMVSFYLSGSDKLFGTHTMLITTTYETSTTGLLSRYLKDEKRIPFTIQKVLPSKVPDAPVIKASISGESIIVDFDSVPANPPVTKYQLTLATLNSPTLTPTSVASYGGRCIVMENSNPNFVLTKNEIQGYFNSASCQATSNSPYVLVRVEAVNSVGNGEVSKGTYFGPEVFGLQKFSSSRQSSSSQSQTSNTTSCELINFNMEEFLLEVDEYNSRVKEFKNKYGKQLRKFVFYDSQYPLEPVYCEKTENEIQNKARTVVFNNAKEELRILDQALVKAENSSKSITCVKGKTTKRVTGISPKCPSGFKRK